MAGRYAELSAEGGWKLSENDIDLPIDIKLQESINADLVERLKKLGLKDKTISLVCNIAVMMAQRHFDKWSKNLEKRLKKREMKE